MQVLTPSNNNYLKPMDTTKKTLDPSATIKRVGLFLKILGWYNLIVGVVLVALVVVAVNRGCGQADTCICPALVSLFLLSCVLMFPRVAGIINAA